MQAGCPFSVLVINTINRDFGHSTVLAIPLGRVLLHSSKFARVVAKGGEHVDRTNEQLALVAVDACGAALIATPATTPVIPGQHRLIWSHEEMQAWHSLAFLIVYTINVDLM